MSYLFNSEIEKCSKIEMKHVCIVQLMNFITWLDIVLCMYVYLCSASDYNEVISSKLSHCVNLALILLKSIYFRTNVPLSW